MAVEPCGVANHNDTRMLQPTLDDIAAKGLLGDTGTTHLDRVRQDPPSTQQRGLHDLIIQKRRRPADPERPILIRLGLRWIVEATNTWLSNYGQLRRNTDPLQPASPRSLAVTIMIIIKLIKWRDRYLAR